MLVPRYHLLIGYFAIARLLQPFASSSTLPQTDEIRFKNLTIEDGLSASGVIRIWQDRYGFMWFGTPDGLDRYDGYSIKAFRNDPNNPNSLSNNEIGTINTLDNIFEDHTGALWIGTEDGLNLYDRQTETFKRFQNHPQDPGSLSNNSIRYIYEDRSGALWFGTHNGLNLFDRKTSSFIRFHNDPNNPNSISGNLIRFIFEDRFGSLWIGTTNGLNLFDRQTRSFTRFQNDPQNPNSLSHNDAFRIHEDRSGGLWIATWGGGLNLFDRQSKSFIRYENDPGQPRSLSNNFVWCMYEDRSGALWIGTYGGGLNLFDPKHKSFSRYQNNPRDSNSMSNDFVQAIHEDNSAMLWIGTQAGLNLFDCRTGSFVRYQNDPQNIGSLSSNDVWCFYEDRSGALWIGTGAGLSLVDLRRKPFIHYKSDPQNQGSYANYIYEDRSGGVWIGTNNGLNLLDRKTGLFTCYRNHPQDPHSLSSNYIWCIHEDREGELWIGTDEGLDAFDRHHKTFKSYRLDNRHGVTPASKQVRSICEDRSGGLWIGTEEAGLNLFDRRTKSFSRYQSNPQDSNSLSKENEVYCVYESLSGELWCGTPDGLLLFDPQRKTFTHYRNDPQDTNSLSSNNVVCIYEDRLGGLWVGTGGGLNLFDRAAGVFRHFRETDGLPNDVVNGILEDGGGRLWLSTDYGISRFNPKTHEFRNYDVSDGLSGNEFNFGASCKTHDGFMYFGSWGGFGGSKGITAFHPDSIKDNPYVPPVVITDLLLFNRPVQIGADYNGFVLPQSVTTADELVLSYREAVFTLDFSALCFVNPQKQKYAYRLEGFDEGWTPTDARRRFATYTNLDPGTYVFRVKGSNHDGIWNEEGRSLRILIMPPWWKTIWAYLGYGFVIVGILYSIRQSERHRDGLRHQAELERARAESLEEVNSLKSRFFANISHEFRTPLTLILGPISKWRELLANMGTIQRHPERSEPLLRAESKGVLSREHARPPDGHASTPSQLGIVGTVVSMTRVLDELPTDLGMMERNAQRLLRLINQLLDLSKLEGGAMKLHVHWGNIVPFVKGLTSSFESSAGMRRIAINIHTDADVLEMYFDKDKLEKIFTNLLSNAFKFTPEGGAVRVSITRHPERSERSLRAKSKDVQGVEHASTPSRLDNDGTALSMTRNGFVEIAIADTGIGIPVEELSRVFDRFYQVDSSQTREHEGTGIGLALTKELVELHHGSISVKSEVGKGTEFTIRLPLGREHLKDEEIVDAIPESQSLRATERSEVRHRKQDETSTEGRAISFSKGEIVAPPKKPPENGTLEGGTPSSESLPASAEQRKQAGVPRTDGKPIVLIVEDNADVRAYMREYLVTGYDVHEAHDGADGIEKAREIIPDLVISDVMMPKKDGYELCKTLKLDEKTSHIPIILLTAKAGTDNKIEGLETGADDYLTKPFDAKELLVRVKNLIELRKKLRERFSAGQVLKPGDITVTSIDDAFLQKAMSVVERRMGDEEFGVEQLRDELGMSRTQLHRKLTALTNQSAGDFIRYMRLQRAKDLLKQNAGTVSEIAYQVGFNSVAYFTKCFREQFGIVPSEVRNKNT